MNYATEKQNWFIKKLAIEAGFEGKYEALDSYGFTPGNHTLSVRDASLVIDWLKSVEAALDAARYLTEKAA